MRGEDTITGGSAQSGTAWKIAEWHRNRVNAQNAMQVFGDHIKTSWERGDITTREADFLLESASLNGPEFATKELKAKVPDYLEFDPNFKAGRRQLEEAIANADFIPEASAKGLMDKLESGESLEGLLQWIPRISEGNRYRETGEIQDLDGDGVLGHPTQGIEVEVANILDGADLTDEQKDEIRRNAQNDTANAQTIIEQGIADILDGIEIEAGGDVVDDDGLDTSGDQQEEVSLDDLYNKAAEAINSGDPVRIDELMKEASEAGAVDDEDGFLDFLGKVGDVLGKAPEAIFDILVGKTGVPIIRTNEQGQIVFNNPIKGAINLVKDVFKVVAGIPTLGQGGGGATTGNPGGGSDSDGGSDPGNEEEVDDGAIGDPTGGDDDDTTDEVEAPEDDDIGDVLDGEDEEDPTAGDPTGGDDAADDIIDEVTDDVNEDDGDVITVPDGGDDTIDDGLDDEVDDDEDDDIGDVLDGDDEADDDVGDPTGGDDDVLDEEDDDDEVVLPGNGGATPDPDSDDPDPPGPGEDDEDDDDTTGLPGNEDDVSNPLETILNLTTQFSPAITTAINFDAIKDAAKEQRAGLERGQDISKELAERALGNQEKFINDDIISESVRKALQGRDFSTGRDLESQLPGTTASRTDVAGPTVQGRRGELTEQVLAAPQTNVRTLENTNLPDAGGVDIDQLRDVTPVERVTAAEAGNQASTQRVLDTARRNATEAILQRAVAEGNVGGGGANPLKLAGGTEANLAEGLARAELDAMGAIENINASRDSRQLNREGRQFTEGDTITGRNLQERSQQLGEQVTTSNQSLERRAQAFAERAAVTESDRVNRAQEFGEILADGNFTLDQKMAFRQQLSAEDQQLFDQQLASASFEEGRDFNRDNQEFSQRNQVFQNLFGVDAEEFQRQNQLDDRTFEQLAQVLTIGANSAAGAGSTAANFSDQQSSLAAAQGLNSSAENVDLGKALVGGFSDFLAVLNRP